MDTDYEARNYATRMCLGIDKDCGGIVVFEPDMAPGTRFQIMYRAMDLGYIRPRVEGLLQRLEREGKEPFFAMYINCAGRCAGYGGADLEDALVIQDLVGDRFPLFGIYAGGEIAPLGGKARSMGWTGVFCVFSRSKKGRRIPARGAEKIWDPRAATVAGQKNLTYAQVEKLAVQNMAKILALDAQSIVVRTELEQKRRGFSLLAELSVALRGLEDRGNIFLTATRRINAALNMQKTVLLVPDGAGRFTPSVLQGFSLEERAVLVGERMRVDADLLDMTKTVLVTGAHAKGYLADLRQVLNLPYFIAAPLVVRDELCGLLITGRMVEAPPILCRLSENEAETMVAFIMIDLDNLKEINDQYGHIVGDRVLEILAHTLCRTFRSTDIIARFGGDEFVVLCKSEGGVQSIQSRVAVLVHDWREMPHLAEDGRVFNATLSVGVLMVPGQGAGFEELVRRADMALYEAKQKGRNRYVVYQDNRAK